MQGAFHEFLIRAGALKTLACQAFLVFVVRHCIIGFLNIALTTLLGLGLIFLARRLRLISLMLFVRARLFLLLCALTKSTFYLLVGDNQKVSDNAPTDIGIQLPSPAEVLFLVPQTAHSILHVGWLSCYVIGLLVGISTFLLLHRALFVWRATQQLTAFARLDNSSPPAHVSQALRDAAAAIGLSPSARLPALLLVNLVPPAPMLLGVFQPRLILPPQLIDILTREELELIIRHELAHFKRRDHWGRWLLKWIEDTGRPNLLGGAVGFSIVEQQEALCDMLAVRSAKDAVWLSRALLKAAKLVDENQPPSRIETPRSGPDRDSGQISSATEALLSPTDDPHTLPPAVSVALPDYVIPSLLGSHWRQVWRRQGLGPRLSSLKYLSEERAGIRHPPDPKIRSALWKSLFRVIQLLAWLLRTLSLLFFLLLVLIIACLKYRFLINLHGL